MNTHLDQLKCENTQADCFNGFDGDSGELFQAARHMVGQHEFADGADYLLGDEVDNEEEANKYSAAGLSNGCKKQGLDADLSDAEILNLMTSNGLDMTSTQSLFTIVNQILNDISERKRSELTQGVASILRKLVLLIQRRFSNQTESLKSQNTIFKDREVKYRRQIRALETLAVGTSAENEVVAAHLHQLKFEKAQILERKQLEEQDILRLKKDKARSDLEVSELKQELEAVKYMHEQHCAKLEDEANESNIKYEKRLKELECLLANSRKRVEELEVFTKSKSKKWKNKELAFTRVIDGQREAFKELRAAFGSVKQEALKTRRRCAEDFNYLGTKLKGLAEAAANYRAVLAENRKLYNEVQDLKGNIRVYCRIRPFLPGQSQNHTTIEYVGENGELIVTNPIKQGKDSRRLFKLNKVFVPTATQDEVFVDTQPLIRSVLDGYNVCIFAYGQTGSGKTHTMSGPSISSKEDWGVNYRALHDLFQISQSRRSSITYEVGVQMVEIYNEQVRDLLSTKGSQKSLGICNTAQPNGLAVPDASMHPVNSMQDVLDLMNIGLLNRAIGATALNERSSRSHSVLTIHIRGTVLESNTLLRGCLHLVDLAGSERVEKSEATGERLKEAVHINKSLSALGDVVSALAQKSQHVPYRNSKLTQVLQSSLGGKAKTLMFVHLNPDVASYSETMSTLKFAERVSGIELGAARSNKEGKDVRDLMDQVASLKDTIVKKDEEIERLRLLKASASERGLGSLRSGSSSPRRHSIGSPRLSRRMSVGKRYGGLGDKTASDVDNYSEHSDKHSEAGSRLSLDEPRNHNTFSLRSNITVKHVKPGLTEEVELLGIGDMDADERLSDISDGELSMGTETDGSMGSVVEYTLFPEAVRPCDDPSEVPSETTPPKTTVTQKDPVEIRERPSGLPKLFRASQALHKSAKTSNPSRLSLNTSSSNKLFSSARKTSVAGSSSLKPVKRWQ